MGNGFGEGVSYPFRGNNAAIGRGNIGMGWMLAITDNR